ncbi:MULTISPECIES: hypothetical protein [unclassified Flavobacterium]|uniref:hypothetical protein n=1 Tax=unclassified Flavobacterium TaxID=196869 RepID=UPI000EB0F003|nr:MULTISPECIES: hypothetical protein [unclassified Flavobacterium]RKS03262.1 hypothetical protein C8C84_3006 [Flavobacterium sp. 102]
MKNIASTIFLFLSILTFAQESALADLKFEEAEIAFNNKNYSLALNKVDEFDKLLGTISDKSLYIRIISLRKLFNDQKLWEDKAQSALLFSLQKYTAAYVNQVTDLDDRYREVYDISQELKFLPKTEADYKVGLLDLNIASGEYFAKVKNATCEYYKNNNRKMIYEWKGVCENGFVSGDGILTGYYLGTKEVSYQYTGKMKEGKENGIGTAFWYNYEQGQAKYEGNFVNGSLEGYGVYENYNVKASGLFKDNAPNGEGKFLFKSSNTEFSGILQNGKPYNGKLVNLNSGKVTRIYTNGTYQEQ